MGNKEVKIVCYADDIIIISEDEDNIQSFLHKFELTAEKYKMSISVQIIQLLMIAKYFEANITSNRNLEEEMQAQII